MSRKFFSLNRAWYMRSGCKPIQLTCWNCYTVWHTYILELWPTRNLRLLWSPRTYEQTSPGVGGGGGVLGFIFAGHVPLTSWNKVKTKKSQPWRSFWYPVLVSIAFDDFTSPFLALSVFFDWEDISNTRDSAFGYPNTSNFAKCASYFQLSSRCLDIMMEHCLSCFIYYIKITFHYLLTYWFCINHLMLLQLHLILYELEQCAIKLNLQENIFADFRFFEVFENKILANFDFKLYSWEYFLRISWAILESDKHVNHVVVFVALLATSVIENQQCQ